MTKEPKIFRMFRRARIPKNNDSTGILYFYDFLQFIQNEEITIDNPIEIQCTSGMVDTANWIIKKLDKLILQKDVNIKPKTIELPDKKKMDVYVIKVYKKSNPDW